MSVRTTADDLVDSAKKHLDEAFKCLLTSSHKRIFDTKTQWVGSTFYTKYYG